MNHLHRIALKIDHRRGLLRIIAEITRMAAILLSCQALEVQVSTFLPSLDVDIGHCISVHDTGTMAAPASDLGIMVIRGVKMDKVQRYQK